MTFNQWDDHVWELVSPIYDQAFEGKGAKPKKIIRNMFQKQLCYLHIGLDDGRVTAMALTGILKEANSLLIDYLAVKEELRGQGMGRHMLEYIEKWARNTGNYNSLILEVEAYKTSENQARVTFWERCGFVLTEYIHQYIWVPEPYQAMYKKITSDTKLSSDGKILFTYIGQFHKESFQQ
ncbi:GNAT family N-acetyltransferase [Neobacillus drentensis]|uniref:GNAT family N-acetyltransferase n=1 Tax=Neobacillus drentensis TaxID=220684 RepID=UPI002FFFA9AC